MQLVHVAVAVIVRGNEVLIARRSDDVQNLLRLDHVGKLRGGFVTYANASKSRWLGVNAEVIDAHGAVSEPVVRAMASGAKEAAGAAMAVAVDASRSPRVSRGWSGAQIG